MSKTPLTSIRRLGLALSGLLLLAALAPASAFAADCVTKLKQVRTEDDGKVMVRFTNNTWHVIANDSHPARAERLSLVSAALLSDREVMLRYSGSYSCSSTNYGTVPVVVELH